MKSTRITGILISLSLALGSGLLPAAAAAGDHDHDEGAPVYFDFNPQDVAKYDAVVVTVCGLSFRYIPKSLFERIFRAGQADSAVAANLLGAEAPGQDELLSSAAQDTKLPDTYVEDSVTAMLTGAGKHYMVVPLRWNRIVAQTPEAEANLQDWLPQVYAAAQANHKPFYIFAHSWGSVMTRHVLAALVAKGSPVHVDKYITVGSPLVPANPAIVEFDQLELSNAKEDYGESVRKPANVAVWTNFWAKRDVFSNAIPAADVNYRVDDDADRYQELLRAAIKALKNPLKALKDLKNLENFAIWHFAYMLGYHQTFPAISSHLDLDIPNKDIAPNAF